MEEFLVQGFANDLRNMNYPTIFGNEQSYVPVDLRNWLLSGFVSGVLFFLYLTPFP